MNTKMMFTRSIKGLPSTIFVILLATRRLMPVSDLVVWADSNDDDVRKALRVLEGMQVVSVDVRERGEKWYGLAQGYQAMLPGLFEIEDQQAGLLPGSDKSDSEITKQQKTAQNSGFSGKNAPESDLSDSGSSRLESLESSSSLKDLEDSDYLDSGEPGSDFSDAEFAGKTTPEILCREAYRLLGKSVRFDDTIGSRPIREILAWMAQGYQSRDELMSPVGFVYRALRHELKKGKKAEANKQPDPQYLESPFEYLSYDYLAAVGLGEYHVQRCKGCGEVGGAHAVNCSESAKYVEYVSETVVRGSLDKDDLLVGDWPETTDSLAAVSVWGSIKEHLQQEMPRASYDTWVKDARMLGYKAGIVYIAVRNSYAKDWIQARLGELIGNNFADQINGYQAVEIVVKPTVDTETEQE